MYLFITPIEFLFTFFVGILQRTWMKAMFYVIIVLVNCHCYLDNDDDAKNKTYLF